MIYINIHVYSNSIRPAHVPMIKATCFKGKRVRVRVKGALQLQVNAIGKIALLRYVSEFRLQVLTAITSNLS